MDLPDPPVPKQAVLEQSNICQMLEMGPRRSHGRSFPDLPGSRKPSFWGFRGGPKTGVFGGFRGGPKTGFLGVSGGVRKPGFWGSRGHLLINVFFGVILTVFGGGFWGVLGGV